MPDPSDVHILSVDRVSSGIVVTFSDGTTTLYQADFLYKVREDDGNRELVEEEPESSGQPPA